MPNNNGGLIVAQSLRADSLLADSSELTEGSIIVKWIDSVNTENIKLYPNPASQRVTIEIPDVENSYSLTILNNSSQVLMTDITLNEKLNNIDIRNLSKGVYQVVIKGKNKVTHFKLVVE